VTRPLLRFRVAEEGSLFGKKGGAFGYPDVFPGLVPLPGSRQNDAIVGSYGGIPQFVLETPQDGQGLIRAAPQIK